LTDSVLLNKKWNTDHHQALRVFSHIENIPTTDAIKIIDTRTIEQSISYPVDDKSHRYTTPKRSIYSNDTNPKDIHQQDSFLKNRRYSWYSEDKQCNNQSYDYEKNVEWIYVIEENGIKKHSIHANEFKHSTDYSIINLTGEQQNTKNNNIYMSLEDLAKNVTTLDKDKT
jgi:hypothetical protein